MPSPFSIVDMRRQLMSNLQDADFNDDSAITQYDCKISEVIYKYTNKNKTN